MPWTAETYKRHNKHLSPAQAAKAAVIANGILKKTHDEGKAIRVANSRFEVAAGRKLGVKKNG